MYNPNPQTQASIITKFKKNRHFLSTGSLSMVQNYIQNYHGNNKDPLNQLIKKINEMTIKENSSLNQKILKRAIDLLIYTNNMLDAQGENKNQVMKIIPKTYQQLIQQMYNWSILYISPYQNTPSKFFDEKPQSSIFKFQANDKVNMYLTRFKKIRDYNRTFYPGSNYFIGVLFEKFSMKYGKIQLVLQDEVAQIVINLPKNHQTELDCFLIPGCTYIVKGHFHQTVMNVEQIIMPKPLPLKLQLQGEKHENLVKLKFQTICQNINQLKDSLDFQAKDFIRYDCIYNDQGQKNKPVLIFGNITINKSTIQRIYHIVAQFPKGTQCLILVLSDKKHQQIDLNVWFSGHKVYLIPHINSEGPRILPKIPVMKNDYRCKVLSNPARISIHGRQTIFINYPLVKNLYAKNLIPKEMHQINKQQMLKKISDFLFSQNNVAISNDIFWKQSEYMNINAQNLLFICDNACPHIQLKNKNNGGIVSIGDFQRDKQFITYFPKFEDDIQFCQEPQD